MNDFLKAGRKQFRKKGSPIFEAWVNTPENEYRAVPLFAVSNFGRELNLYTEKCFSWRNKLYVFEEAVVDDKGEISGIYVRPVVKTFDNSVYRIKSSRDGRQRDKL